MRPLYRPDAHHDTHTNQRQVHCHISALKSTEPLYKYDQFKHVTHKAGLTIFCALGNKAQGPPLPPVFDVMLVTDFEN